MSDHPNLKLVDAAAVARTSAALIPAAVTGHAGCFADDCAELVYFDRGRGQCPRCGIAQVIAAEDPEQIPPGVCKGCKATIKFIRATAGKFHPVDPDALEVDGRRVLVFADGSTGRTHAALKTGYVSHFATCPKAERFRRAQ